MGTYYKNQKTASNDAVFYLKKYAWIPIVTLFAVWFFPFIKRMMDRINARDTTNQNNIETKIVENVQQNAVKVNNAENAGQVPAVIMTKKQALMKRYPNITKARWNDIFTSAQLIASAFNVDVSSTWINGFLGVTWESGTLAWMQEDEATAVKELKKFTGSFNALSDAYFTLFTLSRNLKADCYKYLSTSDLEEVRKKHLPYKNL